MHRHLRRAEHVFNEDAIPLGGICYTESSETSRQARLSASERRLLRGGSSKDEQSASHQAVALAPQRSITWVTAPISLPFWIMGLPDTSVVKKGQQILIESLYLQCLKMILLKIICICAASFQCNIDKVQNL